MKAAALPLPSSDSQGTEAGGSGVLIVAAIASSNHTDVWRQPLVRWLAPVPLL